MFIRDFNNTIELENNGQLSIFFLGTGTAFSKTNLNTNILAVKGNTHLLIDCGVLCPFSFHQFNTKINEIDNILITHSHSDHAGGLEELALRKMYLNNSKLNIIITDEYKKILWNDTLKGGLGIRGEENMRQKLKFDDYFNQYKPSKIKNSPRPFYEINFGTLNIKIFRTKHEFTSKNNWKNSMYSTGVLIDNRIIFTSDTKFDKDLIDWMIKDYGNSIEHIFHDCSFIQSAVHTSYDELKTLPDDIKRKMTLCHYKSTFQDQNVSKDGFAGLAIRGKYYDF